MYWAKERTDITWCVEALGALEGAPIYVIGRTNWIIYPY